MAINTTELARICNVSRGTVDRALHDRPGIKEETKAYILQMARERGYIPHLLASSLATGKTHTIGIIVFDLENRHFCQLVTAVQQQCSRRGVFCYICVSGKDQDQERRLVDDLISRRVDGLIIVPINQDASFCERLRNWGKPVVTVTNRLDGRFSFVGCDGGKAVYAGMQAFYDKGYRQVLFLCPPYRRLGKENLYAQEIRVDGFRRFCLDHPQMKGELIDQQDYLSVILQRIMQAREKIGVFCCSDHYALKVYRWARQQGFSVPREFGLMGFDGIDSLDYVEQRITTIFCPARQIGEISAACLLDRMEGRDEEDGRMLVCPVMEGETI